MHRQITGRLVIATHNPGKLAEMRELLAPHGVEAMSAGELGLGEPEETGDTFCANARIKAAAAANAAQLPAFADDSGLVVDALDGAPVLDLDYPEDSACDTDLNVVMNDGGGFIELQGTAEGHAFRRDELDALLGLAQKGISELLHMQREALARA